MRRVALLLTGALAVTVGLAGQTVAASAAGASSATTAPTSKAARVDSRPDLVSARVTARAQGSRVEVTSLRVETSTTWVNPDGTLTTQQHLAPIRFRDPSAQGGWRDVDLTMAANPDGTVGPKGHPQGLSLAGSGTGAGRAAKGGASTDLVAAQEKPGKDKAPRGVTLGWPGQLGTPALSGTTATYRDVKPGVDLVVDARRTGFEEHLVITGPAALAGLADGINAGAPVSWRIPLKTRGLTARPEKDGSVSFVAADGTVASQLAAPVAWDAVVDPHSGDHPNVSPVAMTLTQQGKGSAVLTLTPDQAWLSDPARVFPVTIDPTYASNRVTSTWDTYVSSTYSTASYASSTDLKVGTYNGGSDITRSYLNFPNVMRGLTVMSAQLNLYESWSWSCGARDVLAYPAAPGSASSTWAAQPNVSWTTSDGAALARGFDSSCGAAWVSVPVTDVMKLWSTWSSTTAGLMLKAGSETDNYAYKKFSSTETAQDPYITYTYDRAPNVASAPTLESPPGVSYYNQAMATTYLYTSDSTPQFSSTATDPDGSSVKYTVEVHSDTSGSSASLNASCTTGYAASGATGSCSPATALADNAVYYVRASVTDDQGISNASWSAWTTFRTAIAPPPAPVISCPSPYTNGTWTDAVPAVAVSCTVTAAGTGTTAPAYIQYSLDGAAYVQKAITPSSDPNVAKVTVTVPNVAGAHSIAAYSQSTTSVSSTTQSYGFGYGTAALSAPAVTPRATTTGALAIAAAGPPRGPSSLPTAKVRWRVASSGQDASPQYWNDATSAPLTVTDHGSAGVSVAGSWDTTKDTADTTVTPAIALNPRVPVLLDVQVCLTYSTGTECTWSQTKTSVMRVPHAFGNGFPTAPAGPGQVALFTGELTTAVTDAAVPGYTGSITLGRSHSTYGNAPTAATDAVTGVFGPGWTADLTGSDAGRGGLQAIDSTRVDGTITFLDADGTALTYLAPGAAPRRTGANLTAGTYAPVDEDTMLSGTTLTVAGTGTATTLTLKQDDGTATVFQPETSAQAPSVTTAGLFSPKAVTEPGGLTTTYTRDGAGRVTRILAPIPPGTVAGTGRPVACPDGPVAGLDKGCRALRIAYAAGTAVNGVTPTLVQQVTAELYNPTAVTTKDCAGNALTIAVGMASVPIACYTYDTANRLTSVEDPPTGLATGYAYGSANQLTAITPPGQATITFAYATLEQRLKLTAVTRAQPAPLSGTANLARFAYGIPTTGTAGLPDLGAAATAAWAQAKAPTYAAAVFGPDYTGTVTQADGATPTASDWSYADLSYTTADGYTVNAASYGAGAWQRTATDYDAQGNVVRQLDARAINAITSAGVNPGIADQYATTTSYNVDLKDTTGAVVTPAGTLVTDTYGPLHNTAMADGTVVPARAHTHTTYDQGAPNVVNGVAINAATGQPWRLPTTVTTTAADSAGTDIAGQGVSSTTTGYDAQVGGTGDGWSLGQPTKVTTAGISRVTVYDSVGRVSETRQPLSADGSRGAGITRTVYYTADAAATDSRCDNKPEWAGLPCAVGPAADPVADAGTTLPAGATTLPSSLTSGYSTWLTPIGTVETSGSATRTSTTTTDAAGRTVTTATTSTIPGSSARPAVYTHYDPATGLVDYTGPVNKPVGALTDAEKTTVYDAWGRPTTTRAETPTAGVYDTTVTAYDTASRVATVTDPKGTTTTTWDGTDATGATERRGLATKVTVTRAGASGGTGTLDFAAGYDANGALTLQKLPGGLTQTTTFDLTGEPVGLAYRGQVTPSGGTPTTGTWMAWTQATDVAGRVRLDYTGQGSSFDPTAAGVTGVNQVAPTGNAVAYDRQYTYDAVARLTGVQDRTATTTGDTLDPTTAPTAGAPCTVRSYSFDGNGRRTARVTATHANGDCATTADSTTTTDSNHYDTADRPTTGVGGAGAYTYDAFGRQTVIPAVDTPKYAGTTVPAGSHDLAVGYYDDDLARTISQDGTTTTLGLDSGGRRITSTTVAPSGTTTLERHYSDGSDNPAWTVSSSTGVTRYAESLGGDLSVTIGADGSATLPLSTLHGDVVTTVAIPAAQASSTACTTITGWSDYSEYGAPRDAAGTAPVAGSVGYGWLGAKQRSTTPETAGLTLMGDRLYNSATGRFTSLDPEPGGSANAYAYPTDPINQYDLNGHWWGWLRQHWRGVASAVAFGVCVAASAGACLVAGTVVAGLNYAANAHRYGATSHQAVYGLAQDMAWNIAGFGAGGALARFGSRGLRGATSALRRYVLSAPKWRIAVGRAAGEGAHAGRTAWSWTLAARNIARSTAYWAAFNGHGRFNRGFE